jgi:hypothetical protein
MKTPKGVWMKLLCFLQEFMLLLWLKLDIVWSTTQHGLLTEKLHERDPRQTSQSLSCRTQEHSYSTAKPTIWTSHYETTSFQWQTVVFTSLILKSGKCSRCIRIWSLQHYHHLTELVQEDVTFQSVRGWIYWSGTSITKYIDKFFNPIIHVMLFMFIW